MLDEYSQGMLDDQSQGTGTQNAPGQVLRVIFTRRPSHMTSQNIFGYSLGFKECCAATVLDSVGIFITDVGMCGFESICQDDAQFRSVRVPSW
jgi:hypothetical protein